MTAAGVGRGDERSTRGGPMNGQVHKVIRLVATSRQSWEDATRRGVQEAAKSITDLETARITDLDVVIDSDQVSRYRVKLEMVFQLDRSRRLAGSDDRVIVRRYLLVANQTLVSQALHQLVQDRIAIGPSEFHILAPQTHRSLSSRVGDRIAVAGRSRVGATRAESNHPERRDAEDRLRSFRFAFADLGQSLTGEVGTDDPVASVRRVMERSSFDEIIVSMLPTRQSRWHRHDLPGQLERAFTVPVTTLIHDEGDDISTCPIG